MPKKFPRQIYVKRQEDGDVSFLVTRESLDEAAERGRIEVATYELVETQKVRLVAQVEE